MPMQSRQTVDRNDWRSLYPFRSHFLDRDGLPYHYLDEGRGEPLLMVHGNPTWSFYFRRLVTAFSHRWRCVVPDHIGCGLSAKPPAGRYGFRLRDRVDDLSHLCDHLGLERRVTLIVHDWGGMIGLAWALENLERVGRLVVLNTSGFLPPQGKPIPWRLRLVRNLPALAAPAVLAPLSAWNSAVRSPSPRSSSRARVRASAATRSAGDWAVSSWPCSSSVDQVAWILASV